ncbi:MAG: hypothetical protein IKN17_10630 [Ruminococcus sp.]|nr:hypothetical protein [Ruminococcus sp.]
MTKRLRIAAGAFVLIFTLLIFGAAAYEAVCCCHECEGEGCRICEQLENCERLLTAGAVCASAAAVIAVFFAAFERIKEERASERNDTLFTLRVLLLS